MVQVGVGPGRGAAKTPFSNCDRLGCSRDPPGRARQETYPSPRRTIRFRRALFRFGESAEHRSGVGQGACASGRLGARVAGKGQARRNVAARPGARGGGDLAAAATQGGDSGRSRSRADPSKSAREAASARHLGGRERCDVGLSPGCRLDVSRAARRVDGVGFCLFERVCA